MRDRPIVTRPWRGPTTWVSPKFGPLLRTNQARAVAAALEALEGKGYRLLRDRRGIMLADDVGMGKTREAIASAALFLEERPRGRVLFLVPPSLTDKWRAEIRSFISAALPITKSKKLKVALNRLLRHVDAAALDQWVASMSQARDKLRPARLRRTELIVIDEAHRARNPATKLSQAIRRALDTKPELALLLLTATPFQVDQHRELVNLLGFLDRNYRPGDGSEWTSDRGYNSIVSTIAVGLKNLKVRLKQIEGGQEVPPKTVEELLVELNENVDQHHDPDRRFSGVVRGRRHDGFDEYLRALIVRTTKPRIKSSRPLLSLAPGDAAAYLFGKAYARNHRRLASGDFAADEPPPGAGFLPNAYSRLCSAFAAQYGRSTGRTKSIHPHPHLARRLAELERMSPAASGHIKIRALLELPAVQAAQGFAGTAKAVVFANHVATVQQLRRVLLPSRPGKAKGGSRVRASELVRTEAWLRRRSDWRAMAKVLKDADVADEDDLRSLLTAFGRALTRIPTKQRPARVAYWRRVVDDAIRQAQGQKGQLRYIRERLEGRGKGASRKLSSGIALRELRPVEYLDGSVPMKRRLRLLQAFGQKGAPPFILVVSQAGSEGQDMHMACSSVVHFDLHWNPTVLHQRTGRVYRDLAKKEDVRVVELALTDGYDAAITEAAQERDAYRDFLLGEKDLRDFLVCAARWKPDGKLRGEWKMDLSPDPLEGE